MVVYVSQQTLPQFGTGADGAIIISSGTVNIDELYENDVVTGVITKRGVDKGLNHGAGTYDPENGKYINSTSFRILSGTTLTHSTAYGDGADNSNGILWVACISLFNSKGAIDMGAKGHAGGAAKACSAGATVSGNDGSGPGYGHKGTHTSTTYDSAGGTSCGNSAIPITTWADIYGSGGGSGGMHVDAAFESGTTGVGGVGGGAIRIYAPTVNIKDGAISCSGGNGTVGSASDWPDTTGGGGGGGAGGAVYIEAYHAIVGTDTITALGGIGAGGEGEGGEPIGDGGGGAGYALTGEAGERGALFGINRGGDGGDGSVGRIHIVGNYTGSTSDPAIA